MDRNIINKFVAMPLAIKVFKLDLEKFKDFKLGNLYLDMLEDIIQRLQLEYNNLKLEFYSIRHLNIKPLGNINGVEQYKVNDQIIYYTPHQLKTLTEEIMNEYINGEKAALFERKNRMFNNIGDKKA